MTTATNSATPATAWAARVCAAFAAPDGAAAFARCFSEDAVQRHPFFPTPHKGRAEIAAAEGAMFAGFSDIRLTTTRVVEGADGWAAVEFNVVAINTGDLAMPDGNVVPATGRTVDLTMASVVHLDAAGLADDETRYQDNLAFLAQLGLLPA